MGANSQIDNRHLVMGFRLLGPLNSNLVEAQYMMAGGPSASLVEINDNPRCEIMVDLNLSTE